MSSGHSNNHSSNQTYLARSAANFVAAFILGVGRLAYTILAVIFGILSGLAG